MWQLPTMTTQGSWNWVLPALVGPLPHNGALSLVRGGALGQSPRCNTRAPPLTTGRNGCFLLPPRSCRGEIRPAEQPWRGWPANANAGPGRSTRSTARSWDHVVPEPCQCRRGKKVRTREQQTARRIATRAARARQPRPAAHCCQARVGQHTAHRHPARRATCAFPALTRFVFPPPPATGSNEKSFAGFKQVEGRGGRYSNSSAVQNQAGAPGKYQPPGRRGNQFEGL